MNKDNMMKNWIVFFSLLTLLLSGCKKDCPPISIESEDNSLVNTWFGPTHFKNPCHNEQEEEEEEQYYSEYEKSSNKNQAELENQEPCNCPHQEYQAEQEDLFDDEPLFFPEEIMNTYPTQSYEKVDSKQESNFPPPPIQFTPGGQF